MDAAAYTMSVAMSRDNSLCVVAGMYGCGNEGDQGADGRQSWCGARFNFAFIVRWVGVIATVEREDTSDRSGK